MAKKTAGRRLWGCIPILLVALCGILPSCPSDECTDGKCYPNIESDQGASRLLAINPKTGEFLWFAGVPGERLTIRGLQNNGTSVVVEAVDPCITSTDVAAFTVDTGAWADVVYPVVSLNGQVGQDPCETAVATGVTSLETISGICVGVETTTGDVIGVNPLDNAEMWRSSAGASDIAISGNVLLAFSAATVGGQMTYFVKRIAVTTGQLLWQYPSDEVMVLLGGNGESIFMLGSQPFALSTVTGDKSWTFDRDGWTFVPALDGGMLLGDNLYVKKQFIFESKCDDSD